jgi:hypothetical protein
MPLEFFKRKLLKILKQLNLIKTLVTTSTKALPAPVKNSYIITKNEKSHTTGDTLLLQATIKIFGIMCSENNGQAHKAVPLYNNTMMVAY